MALKKENSNADRGNQPSENMPLGEETIRENHPASKDEIPTKKPLQIKINKTRWDKIGQGFQVLSSFAMVVVTVFIAIFAYKQWDAATQQADAARKQADAATKQVSAANEQIKVAKAQNELMMRMNEEAKRSNLNMNQVVAAYYVGGSDDVKGKIDLVFRNLSSRPTAILAIYLRTKEGSYLRTIGEPDGIKLPLNIGAWSAEKVSFSLKKDDIKQMKDIVVLDLDDRQTPITERRSDYYLQLPGIAAVANFEGTVSSTTSPIKVCKNQTVTHSDITIFVESIKFEKQSGRLVVDVIISELGKKDKHFSSDKVDTCWTYDEYAIRLHSISTDCAEFIISYNEKACE